MARLFITPREQALISDFQQLAGDQHILQTIEDSSTKSLYPWQTMPNYDLIKPRSCKVLAAILSDAAWHAMSSHRACGIPV